MSAIDRIVRCPSVFAHQEADIHVHRFRLFALVFPRASDVATTNSADHADHGHASWFCSVSSPSSSRTVADGRCRPISLDERETRYKL
jgi:hypothetical protein